MITSDYYAEEYVVSCERPEVTCQECGYFNGTFTLCPGNHLVKEVWGRFTFNHFLHFLHLLNYSVLQIHSDEKRTERWDLLFTYNPGIPMKRALYDLVG